MKTVLLTFMTLLTLNSFSQVEKFFKTKERQDVNDLVNEVVSMTTKKYNQVKIDSEECRNRCIEFSYSDGENILFIDFQKGKQGGSIELEIPDTVVYRFVAIRGIYKDIFPFWKKYFDADADFQKVATNKRGKVIQKPFNSRSYVASFNGQDGLWQLQIKDYSTHN